MDTTLRDLNRELSRITTEYNYAKKELDKVLNEKFDIESKINDYRFKIKDYIVDLTAYEGKTITDILCIDSNGDEVDVPTDEIVTVENGRLHCSSFDNGLVFYDDEEQTYIHAYHYHETRLDIIGFLKIEVKD